MINFYDVPNENKIKHNSNWQHNADHPHGLIIIPGSGSRKINAWVTVINQ